MRQSVAPAMKWSSIPSPFNRERTTGSPAERLQIASPNTQAFEIVEDVEFYQKHIPLFLHFIFCVHAHVSGRGRKVRA